ncbi:MAG TPA: carboxypeptidase-like regulatory domain-containing protein [Verrucomicrobiae bacterium]|nr:carboxypeptidase-like regulatory domain-containing protein [Verrucomicrobiae bacterium]
MSSISAYCLALACAVAPPLWAQQAATGPDVPAQQASRQSSPQALPSAPVPQATGSIHGSVVDQDGAVIANATVVLAEGTATSQSSTAADGTFDFANLPPGSFEVTISASGFATQKQSGELQAGQQYIVLPVQMVVAANVQVNVTETQQEIAEEEVHQEEQQRILGVFPNFYVTYVPDAAPLDRKQKFQLGWKTIIDPVGFGLAAAVAGFEQADNDYRGYGQGAAGYGKRLGAAYGDFASSTFFGNVVFPALLKQDPRYFVKGTGSIRSRFFYAVANAVICKGDNGRWQPNYSNILGSLAAGGLSNAYYPNSNRNGLALTFRNTAQGLGGSAITAVIQEFFLKRLTPKVRHQSTN